MRFNLGLLFASLIGSSIAGSSYTGDRLLVVTDKDFDKADYSIFFDQIKGRGFSIDFKTSADNDFKLIKYDDRLYDHLILFSPKTSSYSSGLSGGDIVDFVNSGGNLLMAASSDISKFYQNLGAQFGATFDDRSSKVIDPFSFNATGSSKDKDIVVASDLFKMSQYFSYETVSGNPVLFQGVAHTLNDNPQVNSILKPSKTAYSISPSGKLGATLYGTEISLVSALQAKNNARVTISGSISMFSNKFLESPISYYFGEDKLVDLPKSENANFVGDLTKWTFQEVAVVKAVFFRHHKVGEKERPDNYRIKDDIEVELGLMEFNSGTWGPYVVEDVQIEAIMLDPYIRASLPYGNKLGLDDQGRTYALYKTNITLPDVYGVYTLKVDYRRNGLSEILESDIIPIHPFRHNEYPRFLNSAYPYYISSASMAIGFVLFSVVWLYNKDPSPVAKQKKA